MHKQSGGDVLVLFLSRSHFVQLCPGRPEAAALLSQHACCFQAVANSVGTHQANSSFI